MNYQILVNYAIILSSVYIITHIMAIIISACLIKKKYDNKLLKFLKKVINFQILFNTRVLLTPFFGLAINILLCNNDNSNRIVDDCYSETQIIFAVIIGFINLIILAELAICVFYYFVKSPFRKSMMG